MGNINPGGVIGALIGLGGSIAFFALYQGELPRRSGRLIGIAVLGCAFLGNWLWQTVFSVFTGPAEADDQDEDADLEPVAEES
ncbi:MAG TPA: hypothetical protein VFG20_20135 [Planctomycetaceae bacterium]|nr:hypothetical protein [Planctomycetaceae bacterium]